MVIASLVAPALRNLDQAYQFIQEYVGFIAPGVLAIFLMGFCWKRTTSTAALLGAVLTIPLSTVLKFLPVWTSGLFPDFAFLNRMSIVFVSLVALMTVVTLLDKKSKQQERVLIIDNSMFKPSMTFVVGSVLIIGILTALYTVFW
jgi:SSS family solute:Na+ symporter